MKKLIFTVIIMLAAISAYAADDNSEEKGLFSQGSFFSEAISSVSSKVGRVTSGNEKIIDPNAKGVDKDILEQNGDPFGRPNASANPDNFQSSRQRQKENGF